MSEQEKLEILKEIHKTQKESFELQKEQFEFIQKQYDRTEAIQAKAEKLQDRATSMFKIIGPLIFAALAFIAYIIWRDFI